MLKRNEYIIKCFESQVAFDAIAIVHLATLVKDHRSNCLCVIAENGELR